MHIFSLVLRNFIGSTGKAESPRWHKLTAEDIIDQVLSDSDDEVIKEQSTVAESGCRSYSVFDEQCYVKVNYAHN